MFLEIQKSGGYNIEAQLYQENKFNEFQFLLPLCFQNIVLNKTDSHQLVAVNSEAASLAFQRADFEPLFSY